MPWVIKLKGKDRYLKDEDEDEYYYTSRIKTIYTNNLQEARSYQYAEWPLNRNQELMEVKLIKKEVKE